MADRPSISVAVIARDEERNIGRCLASVRWADEVVVVDSGSSDATVAIARRHGARVLVEAWRGYAGQKNLAVDRASHPWVLSLDADEWLGPEAEGEIRRAVGGGQGEAFAFVRISAFSGAFLRRTWRGDRPIRLFRRDRGRFGGGHVHESVRLASGTRVTTLDAPLYHLTYRSIADYVDRLNRYTSLAAQGLVEEGRAPRLARLLVSPVAAFLKHFIGRGGWREGVRGLVVASGSAWYVFLKYAKHWEASLPPDPDFVRNVPPTPEDPEPGAATVRPPGRGGTAP